MYLILGILLLLVAFLVYASASVSCGLYLKSICRLNTQERSVVLTFDDGPHPQTTPLLLDVLRKHEVKACFFLIGERAESNPGIVKRMMDEGHVTGNHTYGHRPWFPVLGAGRMQQELEDTNRILESITHKRNRLFRPPFGVTNPLIARAVAHAGLVSVGWSIRSLDTMGHPVDKTIRRIMRKLHPGALILLHDDRIDSPELVDRLLDEMQNCGYKIVLPFPE